jgi:hypothetical protein
MARIRSIKPEFWTDPKIHDLSADAALFFIALWNFASDQGVIENSSQGLSLLVPRYRPQVVQHLLSCLWKRGLVACSRDARLWLVVGWRHQKIDKPRAGKWNPNDIEWVTHEESLKGRDPSANVRRKDRIGEDRKGKDRIGSGSDGGTKTTEGDKPPRAPSGHTNLVWDSYSDAYETRYGSKPVSNALVRGQLSSFIKRVGEAEAPLVASFYLTHNGAFYVRQMHPVGLLLKDAEKLRTEWVTNNQMLDSTARMVEQRQHNSDVWDRAAAMVNEAIAESETSGK